MPMVNATVSTIRNGSFDPIPISVVTLDNGRIASGWYYYEKQRITIQGVPTGGTFQLRNAGVVGQRWGSFATAGIAFSAASDDIKNAINDSVPAVGKLTSDNTNVADGAAVTIDFKTYTFKTALTPTEGQVLIGANADASLLNLINAINLTGTPGTDYSCAAAHPSVVADTSVTAHSFYVTARAGGTGGNSIATTETSSHLSWGAATLTSGGYGVLSAFRSQVGNNLYIDLGYYVNGVDWNEVEAISQLQGKPVGEIQRIAWDAAPGKGFWYLEDADGVRTDGIAFDADDVTIAQVMNSIIGSGAVSVSQVPGVSLDVRWLLSGDNQPDLDIFTDHLFTADTGDGDGGGGGSDTKAPIIQASGALYGVVGTAFDHTFTALNSPDSWTAAGIPEGMSFNETTAEFSGTATVIGDFPIVLRATNEFGTSAAVTVIFTVLPSAAAAGGRRIFLELNQRVIAYADTLAIADPLEVSLKDASFVFETRGGVILPGSTVGKLELRAQPFVNNSADFDDNSLLVINESLDITDSPDGQQLLVIGEDWGNSGILGLFSSDQMSVTLLAQLRWRNGDDVAGHWQHSKLFKVNVGNTLFQA